MWSSNVVSGSSLEKLCFCKEVSNDLIRGRGQRRGWDARSGLVLIRFNS